MPQKHHQTQNEHFKYRGKIYIPLQRLRIRGRLYLIVEEWGSEQYATYKAFDVSVQEMRAIRIRPPGLKYEMNLIQIAKMRNSNVPYVYDYWRNGNTEYLVQEWVDGYNLRHYLKQKRKESPYFEVERSYYLIRGLVHGLNKLHERSVFHGDLKPDNLIVADTKRLVMIDFGAAWSGARTYLRRDEKTAGYASPEQWRNEQFVDHRADQFAVSVVLYEMLTGELPYDGRGGWGSDYAQHPPLIAPCRKNKQVWGSLDRVITKGLSLDKNQRYDTSAAWLRAFSTATPPENSSAGLFSNLVEGDFWHNVKATITHVTFHS